MRKTEMAERQMQGLLVSDYGKKKLLGYADSFCSLAKTFTYRKKEESEAADRQALLMKRRLLEDREILADNLQEIARIIRTLAQEEQPLYPFKERELKKIIRACKEQGILVRSIYRTQDEVCGMKLAVSMKVDERCVMTVEEAAEFFSVLFDRRLLAERDSLFFLPGEYETIVFEEEAPFCILTGTAKATRENETVSGDTCSFIEQGNGNLIMALSDGMGSGEKAMADSELVIDLLERFSEAGFSKETAAEMINGVLVARTEEENMSTLDVCDINLYTGNCELLKIGSASTYIKHGEMIERVEADSLPLGIFHKIDVSGQKRQLADGDYIIMVSDGVVDGVDNEEIFEQVLAQMELQSPQEMANYILQFVLHKTMGRVQDDMTVLVLGLWENSRK
jgi:stage II sporulation protein E